LTCKRWENRQPDGAPRHRGHRGAGGAENEQEAEAVTDMGDEETCPFYWDADGGISEDEALDLEASG
jgi:hypothetical protein